MAPTIIDGKAVAQRVRAEVAQGVAEFFKRTGQRPGLATVLVGDDPASAVYVTNKRKACEEVGIEGFHRELSADASQGEVAEVLEELNAMAEVSGILLQLPAPQQIDDDAMVALIDPAKDVDGLSAINAGLLAQGRPGLRPCTPSGVIELLDAYEIAIEGAQAVVLGRSQLVGRPLAALLIERNATVTVCHSRTRDLAGVCAGADILIAAVGVPKMVTAEFIKPGATVIDVGINRTEAGLVGDVDFQSAKTRAGAITPVPGGVGPMTIACLLRNTLLAAQEASARGLR
ncbi:MAG: bifunctional methylenetetrahydrofolate dehydrogenase/methenyltetrahydrofolate cyclohydrolase FolD [Solirubrobacterales bacterium]|nr:bifunctional methylenetetrahydrofolate dehydrogenase/methenyltetrahydrofolate cyclohydrolase FolD [Solirubrobacterales bacterium]